MLCGCRMLWALRGVVPALARGQQSEERTGCMQRYRRVVRWGPGPGREGTRRGCWQHQCAQPPSLSTSNSQDSESHLGNLSRPPSTQFSRHILWFATAYSTSHNSVSSVLGGSRGALRPLTCPAQATQPVERLLKYT